MWKVTFYCQMVYVRERAWMSGRSLHVQNSDNYPTHLLSSQQLTVLSVTCQTKGHPWVQTKDGCEAADAMMKIINLNCENYLNQCLKV